jgi:hypothetical protein
MFHQANLRAYDGTHSLLGDLLDRTLAKYNNLFVLPILSPTMDDLGQRMAKRMQYNTAGVTARIVPGKSITLTAQQPATVPITGLHTEGNESYGGQSISYITLSAGQVVTVELPAKVTPALTDTATATATTTPANTATLTPSNTPVRSPAQNPGRP